MIEGEAQAREGYQAVRCGVLSVCRLRVVATGESRRLEISVSLVVFVPDEEEPSFPEERRIIRALLKGPKTTVDARMSARLDARQTDKVPATPTEEMIGHFLMQMHNNVIRATYARSRAAPANGFNDAFHCVLAEVKELRICASIYVYDTAPTSLPHGLMCRV